MRYRLAAMATPSIDVSRPLHPGELRSTLQRVSDPVAMLVAAVFLAVVATGLHELAGLDGEAVAKLEAAALMIAAAVRTLIERAHDRKIATMANAREARAHRQGLLQPVPPRLHLAGSDEGGELSGDIRSKISGPNDDTAPISTPPEDRSNRVTREG